MIDFAALQHANDPLNAIVEWDRAAAGRAGPLAGMAVAVKSNIAVRGLAWTGGLAAYRERVAEFDAPSVAALRSAGAAILGTANMDEAALGAATRNPHYGWTHNPHCLDRSPGGSSGGSAAAVAAGLCDIALGTDTLGSIRIPASYCGVYGFKPALGAVSRDGLERCEPAFDVIGPIARSLSALEQVARLMSQFGEGPAGDFVTLAALGGIECQPAVIKAYERAAAVAPDTREIVLGFALSKVRLAAFYQVSATLAALLAPIGASLSPQLARLLTYGPARSEIERKADSDLLDSAAQVVREIVSDGSVLLLPTAPQVGFPDDVSPPANQADFACLASIVGLPAISIPAGLGADAMPIGVQLVGRPGAEAGLFAAARRLDTAMNGYRRPAHFYEKE